MWNTVELPVNWAAITLAWCHSKGISTYKDWISNLTLVVEIVPYNPPHRVAYCGKNFNFKCNLSLWKGQTHLWQFCACLPMKYYLNVKYINVAAFLIITAVQNVSLLPKPLSQGLALLLIAQFNTVVIHLVNVKPIKPSSALYGVHIFKLNARW